MDGYRIDRWGAEPTWQHIPEPLAGPNDVVIDVEACGVGLTVLNCINGDLSNDETLLPRVPGHELVGRVVDAGAAADRSIVGRRVVAYFYLSCGSCESCLAGHDSRCSRLEGWVGVHSDGGYAPRVVIPAHNAIPVPENLDPVSATVVPDAVATPIHIAARSEIGPDDRVAVLGAGGGVGIHMVQVAASRGAEVAGLDVVDAKLAQVERLGATAVHSGDFSMVDPNGLFPDGNPTVVVDLLGTIEATQWGLDALAPGGRLVALTTFRDRPIPVESREFVFKETSIIGSRYATRAEVAEAGRQVSAGAITPVIGAVSGPADVLGIHEMLRSGTLTGRGALDWRIT
ncbi:MAG: alcohol dehydrogenase catalytic domain-containing protein [Acidimicrobiia bacterium]|nr:alcohol dehydrogenase catalytic domain-containing protein [Acidimicrobiia bacterium]